MAYKILVCDDAAFYRTMIRDSLSETEFLVAAEADNGEAAVELYTRERSDLVLLDISMPVMDGVTALKKILELDKTAVVVMLAAMGQDSNAKECMALGAKDFVVKPIRRDRMLETLEKALGLRSEKMIPKTVPPT